MAFIAIGIEGIDDVVRGLDLLGDEIPKKVIGSAMNDFARLGPGWIASEAIKEYNIKKSDINQYASIKRSGTIGVTINYKSRRLTARRFSMSPTEPPGKPYTLKATIIKGQRKKIGGVKKLTKKQKFNIGRNFHRQGEKNSTHSPTMLMMARHIQTGETMGYLPLKRTTGDRKKKIKAFYTVSVPQMVYGKRTEDAVDRSISEHMDERLSHYLDRYVRF